MDSFSSYLRKAEEMLQAVDESVAKHMKSEGAIGSLSPAVGSQPESITIIFNACV